MESEKIVDAASIWLVKTPLEVKLVLWCVNYCNYNHDYSYYNQNYLVFILSQNYFQIRKTNYN